MVGHRRGRPAGGFAGTLVPGPRQGGRVGVEAEADLALARLDRARQPVGEGRAQPPLTFCFSPAPAENFGTLPPGIVIRSPVRGFTPWR